MKNLMVVLLVIMNGDSGSEIPSPAFDGVARGRQLGDDSDSDEAPSTPKNVRSSRGNNKEQPSPKKTAAKITTPRNSRSTSKSGSGTINKGTAKQQVSSSKKKNRLPSKKHQPQ